MSIIFNAKTGLKAIRRAANTPSANDGDDFPEPHMERHRETQREVDAVCGWLLAVVFGIPCLVWVGFKVFG